MKTWFHVWPLVALNSCFDFVLMHNLTQRPSLYVFHCCINSGEEDWWVLEKVNVNVICKDHLPITDFSLLSLIAMWYEEHSIAGWSAVSYIQCGTCSHDCWQGPVHNLYVWIGNQSKQIQYLMLDSRSWLTFLFHWSFFHSLWILYKLCRITLTVTNSRAGRAVTPWTCLKATYSNYWHYF